MKWCELSIWLECLTQVELEGLTGHVAFDENGHRRDFELSVNELILNIYARPVYDSIILLLLAIITSTEVIW